MNKNKWFLNGGRESGRSFRLLCETYENKIADLEKENAELRNNGFTVSAMTEQQLKVALEKGEQLEKENAELKDYRLTTLAKQQSGMSKYALNLEHKLSWYDEQLTKAKELLKRCYDNYIYLQPLRGDIEQFLNSEVEK